MDEIRELALDLARRAGEIMTTNFTLGATKTWKADSTPLTVTDLMINEMVLEEVGRKFPDHGIVGEEDSSPDAFSKDWIWICDPVDGTLPFAHGVPTFAFSLGVVHKGDPVLGVINDPMSKRLLFAEKGKGSFLNGEPTKVSSVDDLQKLVVDLEDQFKHPDLRANFRERIVSRGALVTTLWSCVFASSRVASGETAAMICTAGYVWDAAATAVIVTEAGGRVTDFSGNPLSWQSDALNGFVVSNGDIHDALLQELSR